MYYWTILLRLPSVIYFWPAQTRNQSRPTLAQLKVMFNAIESES